MALIKGDLEKNSRIQYTEFRDLDWLRRIFWFQLHWMDTWQYSVSPVQAWHKLNKHVRVLKLHVILNLGKSKFR